MSQKGTAMGYAEKLLIWFDENKREMPWRKTKDPYAIWVSEIMLQQTQVDTVIPYYEKFMTRFPTVAALAAAHREEVYNYWQGLGYYRRAENLHKGAQMIEQEYDGVFPTEIEQVKKIPGIGPYTMGAIMSIAFHMPVPAVDGNVMRILSRYFLIDADISVAKNRKLFDNKVMELMPEDPNRFNQALMELGALVCTPKNPKCNECPVQEICRAYQTQSVEKFPVKTPKTKVIPMGYKVLLIKKGEGYWMEKRPEEGLLANLWGFPMLEKSKSSVEIQDPEEIEGEKLGQVVHVFTHRKWVMEPVVVMDTEQPVVKEMIAGSLQGKFMTLKEMKSYPIGTAFKRVIRELEKYEI
ncbi:MAG: A/G-specific adenine glycosylase [Clostridia bacterium]|nr:A/G-specific adenine glycosylase [Clostridia bacterium]